MNINSKSVERVIIGILLVASLIGVSYCTDASVYENKLNGELTQEMLDEINEGVRKSTETLTNKSIGFRFELRGNELLIYINQILKHNTGDEDYVNHINAVNAYVAKDACSMCNEFTIFSNIDSLKTVVESYYTDGFSSTHVQSCANSAFF